MEHVTMKIRKSVVDNRLRDIVDIDGIGFMKGK